MASRRDVCMAALLQGTLVRDERTGLGVAVEDGRRGPGPVGRRVVDGP